MAITRIFAHIRMVLNGQSFSDQRDLFSFYREQLFTIRASQTLVEACDENLNSANGASYVLACGLSAAWKDAASL